MIIFARRSTPKTTDALTIPAGCNRDKAMPAVLTNRRSSWAVNLANPYGARNSLALLGQRKSVEVQSSQETRVSCHGPANHSALALIKPRNATPGFDGGAIGAEIDLRLPRGLPGAHDRRLCRAAKSIMCPAKKRRARDRRRRDQGDRGARR